MKGGGIKSRYIEIKSKAGYKIKLRASGFRLVYEVMDNVLIIAVVAVGKRERSEAYELASNRLR